MRHPRVLAAATAAALATAALAAAPANAQTSDGFAEFTTDGSRLTITAPSELETEPSLIPERDDFAFLGEPGGLVWVAGTVDGQTFPTLDATAADSALAVTLDKIDGPGTAWLYTFTGPGFARPLATTDAPGSFELAPGTSTVVVLAVDEPGQYTLELTAETENDPRRRAVANGSQGHPQTAAAASTVYSLTAADVDPESVTASLAAAAEQDDNGRRQQQGAERVVFTDGHIDIGPRFVDGTWTAQVRDDTGSTPVWRELADCVLVVPDAALFDIPAGDDFAFLGDAGDKIYLLPQVQQADLIWPGWNTQDPSVIDGVPGSVDWNLVDVAGPGDFTLFLTGTFGGVDILFNSADSLPQTVPIPRNTHAHGNWTFSEPGVYHMTIAFAATTGEGQNVTDTKVVQLAVGDETDPEDAFGGTPGGGGGGDGDRDGNGGLGGLMPKTGAGWIAFAGIIALAALVIGGLIMVLTRRRRPTADADGPADGPDADR